MVREVTTLAEDVLHGKYVLPEVGVLFVYFQRHRAALPLANIFIVLAEIILFEGEIEPPFPEIFIYPLHLPNIPRLCHRHAFVVDLASGPVHRSG